MSTPLALQDILVSIADSLSQAQQQLNNMPQYDSLGRPSTIYQLPYLDFNIVLSTQFDVGEPTEESVSNNTNNGSNSSDSYQLVANALKVRKVLPSTLKFAAASTKTASAKALLKKASNDTADDAAETVDGSESVTTISGKFVAVLPNEGLPQTIISVSCYNDSTRETKSYSVFLLKVNLINTAGEALAYQRIEFNYDKETSYLLNPDAAYEILKKKEVNNLEALRFTSQEEFTNQDGYAETTVEISKTAFPRDFTIVIRINAGITTKSISILT